MSPETLSQLIKIISGSGVTSLLTEKTLESISKSQERLEQEADTADLKEEVSRQEVVNRITSVQAKALQELAIARRIDTAEEVEIEEFYEGKGDGGVGVGTTQDGLKFGVHGSGNKITRRIYRFKGFQNNDPEIYKQFNEEEPNN